MEQKKNKRMIYIQPDNLGYYDNLKNKAGLINELLRKHRESDQKVDDDYIKRKLAEIDGRAGTYPSPTTED